MEQSGTLLKMKTQLNDPVSYSLPLGESLVPLNELLGQKVSLEWSGAIYCIATGVQTPKSYGQGYSYQAFSSLAQCDMCILKPELCHYHQGTCREPAWGEAHCMQPHIVYLANTSGPKIGITRKRQVPTRWIDQGAVAALPILEVSSRLTSGLIENEIKKDFPDRTNWKKMLSQNIEEIDLASFRDEIYEDLGNFLDEMEAQDLDEEVLTITYPILEMPTKITSLSFDKQKMVEGTLLGIKGQYLIFDTGVINIRKFQGYDITFRA